MKNHRFWAPPRPCLCLICGLLFASCSVFKPSNNITSASKTYKMTVAILPGEDQSAIYNALSQSSISMTDHASLNTNQLGNKEELLIIHFRVQSETQLNSIRDQLTTNGIQIINLRSDD